ncbi:MAG TPA: preprotein translocase subunit YajC [Acidimicrobiales bacterium]|nr:preprotein translocase subunit YajC [Acidimicrobiales bacterium]
MFAASFSTAGERMSLHHATAILMVHVGLLGATSSKKTTTGSSYSLLIILIVVAAAYFLLIRPRSQRARRVQQGQQAVQIGDQVMLTSGIIGRVTWLEGDRARVEIAPHTEIEVLRAAIGRTIQSPVSDEEIAVRQEDDDSHYGDNPYVEPEESSEPATDETGTEAESGEPVGGPAAGNGSSPEAASSAAVPAEKGEPEEGP